MEERKGFKTHAQRRQYKKGGRGRTMKLTDLIRKELIYDLQNNRVEQVICVLTHIEVDE